MVPSCIVACISSQCGYHINIFWALFQLSNHVRGQILLENIVPSSQPKVTGGIDVEPSDNQKLIELRNDLLQYLLNFLCY
jgi:hypothetical protein